MILRRTDAAVKGRRALSAALAVGCAAALGACGNTVQNQPISDGALFKAVSVKTYPAYWLGRDFEGMPISTLDRDPGGAYDIAYGNCAPGGQDTCVTPLRVITSPDNSFLPGGRGVRTIEVLRGRRAAVAQGGRTITLATGPVVVTILARTAALAHQAAATMAPINLPGAPADPLPPPVHDTGYAGAPIPSTEASTTNPPTGSAAAPGGVGNAVGTSH